MSIDFDPWGKTTVADPAALLDEVRGAVSRYVVLPSEEALDAVVLWTVATHAVNVFEHATRLCVHSPEKRCGKSRLLEVVESLAYRPLATTNASVAALFRMIGAAEDGTPPPTLLLDEADRLFGTRKADDDNRELIGLLNNGFRKGKPTIRCVGPQQTPTPFENFAMAAVAGIGRLPDTIEDRGINITMRRRLPGEKVHKFRLRTDLPNMHELRARLTVWAEESRSNLERLPSMPSGLEDRAEDAWEPLIAVADAAGGRWPAARAAAVTLSREQAENDTEASLNMRLLADIDAVFAKAGTPFLRSSALIERLHQIEESPWRSFELNPSKLGRRLREYGIKTGHNTTRTERGYRLEDFTDAFERYTRPKASEGDKPLKLQDESPDTLDHAGHLEGVQPSEGVRSKPLESQAETTADAIGRQCRTCSQPLLLNVPGRDVCELCRIDQERAS